MIKLAAAAVVLVLLAVFGWHMEYGTQRNATFTIAKMDDQASSKGHKYLIFTTDNRVFEDTDSWLHGKTDSSQIWAAMSAGQTWTCPVYGFRAFWASSYPDILDGCRQVTRG